MYTTVPLPKETLLCQELELFSVIKYAVVLSAVPWRVMGPTEGMFSEADGKDGCRVIMSVSVLVLLSISA